MLQAGPGAGLWAKVLGPAIHFSTLCPACGLVSRGDWSWAEFALVWLRVSTYHRERNVHGRQMKIRIEWCLKEG